MEVLEAIFTRRSIRKYTGEPVSEDDLKTVLRAGFYAPSASNTQPWHFVVVRNPSMLEGIVKLHPYSKMLPQAGCCVIVCGDREKQPTDGFLVQDCSAAIQNILLAAHGIGLGAVWCGLFPVSERLKSIAELLQLPATILPVAILAIGHKDEEKQAGERYNSERVHLEGW